MVHLNKIAAALAITICTACATQALPVNAAQDQATTTLTINTGTAITQVENYFNTLKTLQSDFIQTAADGTLVSGTFYLKRPGKLRFEYDDPIGDYIVADGLFIHFWDDELKEHNNAPIGSTLADFLLRKEIRLNDDLKVTDVRETPNGKLRLTLNQKDDPNAGKIALLFNQSPLQLEKWRIIDATGAMTEVALNNIRSGHALDATLFVFKPPQGHEDAWQDR